MLSPWGKFPHITSPNPSQAPLHTPGTWIPLLPRRAPVNRGGRWKGLVRAQGLLEPAFYGSSASISSCLWAVLTEAGSTPPAWYFLQYISAGRACSVPSLSPKNPCQVPPPGSPGGPPASLRLRQLALPSPLPHDSMH